MLAVNYLYQLFYVNYFKKNCQVKLFICGKITDKNYF